MKRDYFYTSPLGRRLFQLDLGPLTLALIGSPDHALLDSLASKYEPGSALCAEILAAKNINYRPLLDEYAPVDPAPVPRQTPIKKSDVELQITVEKEEPPPKENAEESKIAKILDAVSSLPERKKNDGSGRAAAAVANKFNISVSTVYQARTVLKHGSPELIDSLRNGEIPIKTAYKKLLKERDREPEKAAG